MKYFNRAEIENIGRAGSYWEIDKERGCYTGRVLSSFWLCLDPVDHGFTPHMTEWRMGFWESWITLWMSQNVKPGMTCIDLGANMGYYTMFLANHGCKVIAVEPQPKLARLIEASAKLNNFKVRVDVNAIADKQGRMKMLVPNGHGMNASLAYEPFAPNGNEETEVDVYTLDDYCEGEQYYDFIKVDVEGAEDLIFTGAQKFIKENPDCVWLLEWRWDRLKNPEKSAKELFETFAVGYVNYDGAEVTLNEAEQLSTQQNEDWMLVLRRKQ